MEIIRGIRGEFIDSRGAIAVILDKQDYPVRSILHIVSKKGAVRSNHYHKTDSHYCYLLSGRAEYSEKPVAGGALESALLNAGDMVYSGPMMIHGIRFLEDSVLLAFATKSRGQADYEADTVRIKLIPD